MKRVNQIAVGVLVISIAAVGHSLHELGHFQFALEE